MTTESINMKLAKKAYVAPEVVEFGTLRSITLGTGNRNNNDNGCTGGCGNNKTTI